MGKTDAANRARKRIEDITWDEAPGSWAKDLERMKGGETARWFIHASRPYLLKQGYVEVVLDDGGFWIGDRITAAGLKALP